MNKLNDNLFLNAYDSIGDGLWDWNIETNEVFYSHQWKKMLGFESNEIENDLEEWKKRVHPDDINNVYKEIQKHLNNETPIYTSQHRVLCKNGTYKWILDRGKVVKRDKKGNALRAIGIHTDINDKVQNTNDMMFQRKLLESISKIAEILLKNNNFNKDINEVLKILGSGVEASRVYIFKIIEETKKDTTFSQIFEWCSEEIEPQIDNPILKNISLKDMGFSRWLNILESNKSIYGHIKDFPVQEQEVLLGQRYIFDFSYANIC